MSDPGSEPAAPDPLSERRRKVAEMAYALGIALYLAEDGKISQSGPGERVEPPASARPTEHGHGRRAEAAAAP